MQNQYLIAIVPAAVFFILYVSLMARPLITAIVRWWHTRIIEKESNNTLVSLIHTQPTGLLDLFRLPMITLEDSHKVLRALKDIPASRPIKLVLHTPGGMVIAAEQIARAIKERKGSIEAYVPQFAMSGGTLIALACDRIHLADNAVLGPLDPQLSVGMFDQYPCASLVKSLSVENPHRDDRTLIYADVAAKAIKQMKCTVYEILSGSMDAERSQQLASILCEGNYTHDYGFTLDKAKEMGLPVDNDIPARILKIANTFSSGSFVHYRKPKKRDNDEKVLRVTL